MDNPSMHHHLPSFAAYECAADEAVSRDPVRAGKTLMRKLAIHEIDGKVQFHSVLEVRTHPPPQVFCLPYT
jgi:hypothetical protein